ncbi:MAG: hypothetical protein HY998_02200 [candidate division NC10 bacterium]|nr:hypothetical protein [candidate division NC10 bacterium]
MDFIVRKDTDYRQEEFRRRRRVPVEDVEVAFVSPEDLILSKLVWARESRSDIQLADVRNLLANVEDLDRKYLKEWAGRLGLEETLREMTR